jgi:exonuclease I
MDEEDTTQIVMMTYDEYLARYFPETENEKVDRLWEDYHENRITAQELGRKMAEISLAKLRKRHDVDAKKP